MVRLFKLIFFLIFAAAASVIGYAYLGDLSPNRVEVTIPVEINAD